LGNDVFRNAIKSSIPAGGDLTGDCQAESKGLGNKNTDILLQFNKPLPVLSIEDKS